MLQLTPQSRAFLAREPADFRRGIDGLAALVGNGWGRIPWLARFLSFATVAGRL